MLGILLMNTGTPDAPTPEAIRPYLKEFLSDRNVVDIPPFLWQPILNLFILPNRPKKQRRVIRRFGRRRAVRSCWNLAGNAKSWKGESANCSASLSRCG